MGDSKIACVIPTIRPEMHAHFVKAWQPLFDKHNVRLITVWDGDAICISDSKQQINGSVHRWLPSLEEELLISKKCAASRNLGFLYVSKYCPEIEYIITLDDDEEPIGDPIQDHINALNKRVPISWFPTTLIEKPTDYMRGFPYGVRTEAEVVISHGIWENNVDYDAPTQLLATDSPRFYRGPIPKGVFFPFCGMNVAFKRKVLPYVYYAPVGQFKGAERFDDILAGILMKKKIDELGYAIVTGYAVTNHTRASNVFHNLEHEAVGIRHNEEFWKDTDNYNGDPFFQEFREKYQQWQDYHL
jgi:reversibly glycosylated polypeptide/UDP-arabinopyranose mutase